MTIDYRSVADDERTAFFEAVARGFGSDPPEDDQDAIDRFWALMPLDRSVAAFDDGNIVATLGDFALRLTVPGGDQIAMAGTTEVTVRPTHRRRGILREMMQRHLAKAAARGEAVAGLWASEAAIYGRFGFGLATELHEISLDSRLVEFPPAADHLQTEIIDPADLFELVAPFWSSLAPKWAGFVDRDEPRWRDIIADPPWFRGGATKSRSVVVRDGDEIVGYAAYRQNRRWEASVPTGTVMVQALVAANIEAHRTLWHHVTHVDLFPMVEYWDAPVDDPIVWETSNPRAVKRMPVDGLYLRILDVGAALQARSYESDGEIVIAINDDLGHADGTYHVEIDGGAATVTATDATPDIEMDVRQLGALYLGRNAAPALHTSGHIVGSAASVLRCSQLFRTAQAPWCPEMF